MPERTCAERIPAHLEGRLADFAALGALASAHDEEALKGALSERPTRALFLDLLEGLGDDPDLDEVNEAARERMYELPLAISSTRVFRVDLSTGGPADWLEVFVSGDTPNYEPAGDGEHYEVERIVYHFSDWFDHAERQLDGEEYKTAERFVSGVIPELVS